MAIRPGPSSLGCCSRLLLACNLFFAFFVPAYSFALANENVEPKFVHQVFEGGNVSMKCSFSKSDSPVIKWSHQNSFDLMLLSIGEQLVASDDRYSVYASSDKDVYETVFNIRGVKSFDAGTYGCRNMDSDSEEGHTHLIEVFTPLSVSIVPDLPEYVVKSGETVILSCLSFGEPTPWLIWKRHGKILPSDHDSHNDSRLVIQNTNKDDSGTYQCFAENQLGSNANASIVLTVHYAPIVKSVQHNVMAVIGQDVELNCTCWGSPLPQTDWSFDGYALKLDDPSYKGRLHSTVYTDPAIDGSVMVLRISKIQQRDFGLYSCQAVNNQGIDAKTIRLLRTEELQKDTHGNHAIALQLPFITFCACILLSHILRT